MTPMYNVLQFFDENSHMKVKFTLNRPSLTALLWVF